MAVIGNNSIIFNNREYATLDGTCPMKTEYEDCKEQLEELPPGWEIAPTTQEVDEVCKYPWGCRWLVCSDGRKHATTLNSAWQPGNPRSGFKKVVKRHGKWKPVNRNHMDLNDFAHRVLIRKCLPGARPSQVKMSKEFEEHSKFTKLIQKCM
eukprot:gnl/MRDRNA2_/MRDRNA2_87080_c0_seq1.p2 gnl/MRDRNA2_/MRDRNA2_87080_c0~~gnl/MRDRNA2_/MRDRNA2_87080_c0_seq1.p2  ORF type:complete len:152 (+),score=24.24 gnl/MRDRNA2_/MRDRNA2_87080_c0_seq1:59-514(+)